MKLWDNDIFPCCEQVSESTTMHLYLCPHSKVAIAREKSLNSILTCLETVYVDPLMLELITTLWHSGNLILDSECCQDLKPMYNTLRDIGLYQIWLCLLHTGMVEYKANYYLQIGSRKSAKKWGLDFVQKML